jgi:membrane protein implicated in regulation of membrane protease activity
VYSIYATRVNQNEPLFIIELTTRRGAIYFLHKSHNLRFARCASHLVQAAGMEQDFELIQSNTTRLLLVWVGGFALVIAVAIMGIKLLGAGASKNLQLAWFMVVLLGGMYLLYRVGKAVSAVPTRVSVRSAQLTIVKPKSGEEIHVPFAHLTAYRASSFNGAEALRLTLKDASKLEVKVNSRLYDNQDFSGMVAAFETAVDHFQQAAGPASAVRRERNFFEKPISTLVLVVFTAGLVWAGWVVATGTRPVKGNHFMVLSSYIAYLVSWHAARERRNQGDEQGAAF